MSLNLVSPNAKNPIEEVSYYPATCCSFTGNKLNDPVIASCSHLFEKSIVEKLKQCPRCKEQIDWFVSCSELKVKITQLHPPLQLDKKVPNDILLNKNRETVIWKVDAHKDDIHGLLRISTSHFVSGSKDTSLKIWDLKGKCIKILQPNVKKGYSFWVTALSKVGDQWVSGTRDGKMTIWSAKGDEIRTFDYRPSENSKNQTDCKDRNKARINCIFEDPTQPDTIFTGTPKYIQRWNTKNGQLIDYEKAHDNDWVYCIETLEGKDLIVVIGSMMQIWKKNPTAQGYSKITLINESKQKNTQRAHISAIVKLQSNAKLLASALFDGSVQVVDLEKKQVISRYKEHQQRVWSVINVNPHHFASSGDDKKIKIWDLRQRSSVHTIADQPGRVSCLLGIDENQFISASCPEDPFNSKEQGTLTFWDLRFLKALK